VVQSDVVSPSCIHVTAFSVDHAVLLSGCVGGAVVSALYYHVKVLQWFNDQSQARAKFIRKNSVSAARTDH